MGFFKKIESDISVCAKLRCPHCLKESQFTLRELATKFAVYEIPLFALDCSYQLFCISCKYRKDIDDQELSLAMKAIKLYSRLQKREIESAEYAKALQDLEFRSLNELREAAKIWNCPTCHENVPANFGECWKCKTKRPDSEASGAVEPLAAPELPEAVTHPVHPWE
jgi:ribosomal protein L37AE/L43A